MIIVFVSCESKEDAERLANVLIDAHIAACIGIFPVTSYYKWEGKKVIASEYELLIKTTEAKCADLKQTVEKTLTYDIPQIIAVKAEYVSEKYNVWVEEAVKGS